MRKFSLNKKEVELLILSLSNQDLGFKGDKLLNKLKKALIPIKISSRKGKGRGLQKLVCQKIADLLGLEYNQQDDQCLIHSREMSQSGTDVILRGEALKRFPFSIECKATESLSLPKAIEQASSNVIEGTDWMVVHRRTGMKEPVVFMDWSAFERVYKGDDNEFK